MTRYRLANHPEFGSFRHATVAILFALTLGLSPEWEAVTEERSTADG